MLSHQIFNSVGNYNYNAYIYTNLTIPAHFHGNYELIYSYGITEFTVNGISDNLDKGNWMLISPYTAHSLKIPKNSETWVCVFSKDYIPDFSKKYQFINFPKFKCDEKIEKFIIENLLNEKNPEHYLLTACLYLICGQCIKNEKKHIQNYDVNFVKKVVIYITTNIEKNITMQKTADELNYEYHYFSTLFHKFFSINFKKFVNILRFEQACEMLLKTDYSITELSDRCGFESIRNFNRIFKQFSEITPSEYRKTSRFNNAKK